MRKIFDRRKFFKVSGVLAGGLLTSGALLQNANAHEHAHKKNMGTGATPTPPPAQQPRGRMFLQNDLDFKNLKAATQRIYPKDDLGDGAIELGVPYFIDNQLAGAYGLNAKEYMQGPFFKGIPEQGYQTPMIRQDIFMVGIRGFESEAQKKYKKSFFELKETQQDDILKNFESGKVSLTGVSAKYFFALFRDLTIAGTLSDPIYQGNDNKKGWSMMQYAGAQMSYSAFIEGGFQKLPPIGLADMQS